MFKKPRYLVWGLVILVGVGLVGAGIWVIQQQTQLNARLAAIRAVGDPVTLPDLARPNGSPDDNAAVFLQRARIDIVPMMPVLNALTDDENYKAGKLTEEDRKKLKALMDAYPKAFKLIEEAGGCSVYDPQIDYTANPQAVVAAALADLTDIRAVINLLQVRSRLQVAEGQQHEALQTCLLLFRLARRYDGSQLMVNTLVACAARTAAVEAGNRVLRAGAVTDKDRQALETELARHDGLDGFIQALKKERACGVSSYNELKNPLSRPLFDTDECRYLDLVQEQIDLATQPYSEFVKSVN